MKTLREMTVHTAFRFAGLALLFAAWTVVVPPARLAAQEKHDPLGRLVTEALARNLGLTAERLADQRAAADVRAARGLFLPSLGVASRYSYLDGVPNIGDFVNPAYAALNGLLGQNRFPTNLDITLPQRHDSHVELRQPLFNAGILANYSAARGRADKSDIEQQLAEARQQDAAAARVLKQIMRRPLDAPVDVIPDSALDMPL